MINFQEVQLQSYGESQDQDLSVSIQNNGNILKLAGNGWKKIDLPYKITANTILEFDFKSTSQGEIHSIGFDNDNSLSPTQAFKLYGSQSWGIDQFNNYQETGQWQTYRISVGQFFTGDFSYLTFGNDQDVAQPNAESLYRNLKVYEFTDPSPTGQASPGGAINAIGEVGQINDLTHRKQTITLQRHYDNPVIFAQTPSANGGQPVAVRIDNIQSNSFELYLQEPSNLDGKHPNAEDVSYIVLEAGSWVLDDGTKLEVGTLESNRLVTAGFESVDFSQSFSDSPVVFSQIQTSNGGDLVRTRQQVATANSFQVGMEEEEKKQNSGHTSESVGWLAIESGSGDWGGINYQVGQTGDTVTQNWASIDLDGFNSSLNFLASIASYDGRDPAGIRYQNLQNNSVEIKIEEDTSADAETRHTTEIVSFLALQGEGLLQGSKAETPTADMGETGATRDVTQRPFAADSIWNTPIGSEAEYVDAKIGRAKNATVDVDHFYQLSGDDPLQPLYDNGTWGPGRTTGSTYQGISLPLPEDFWVADAKESSTPNNSAAFLMPDGRTLVQVNALTRDRHNDFVYGQRLPYTTDVARYEDIYGSGIQGAHAGSGLSSIGGTIRLGELTGDAPIRHALKVNLWSQKYFSYAQGAEGGLGYRWPAVKADSHASPGTYAGPTPELLNGSLLAIPPEMTPESLGIQTEAGRKLFHAFQDYGAYLADDTGWDAHAIAVEKGVTTEFKDQYGFSFNSKDSAFFEDYMQLFSTLHVVNNNALDNIGGGGTPRAPLAPEFGAGETPALIGDPENNSLTGDEQANRLDGKGGNDLIKAYGGHDFITGGRGHDTLEGGDGNDHLLGDADWDSLSGGKGNDYLDGGFGKDTLSGGDGNDHLSGGSSGDILDGGSGYDTVLESGSQDYFLSNTELYAKHQQFGNHRDTIISIEHFILSGDRHNNTIDASAFTQGSVHLHGGRGHDSLFGSTQNDTLVSSSGQDTLHGGNGNDTFDLTGRSEFLRSSRSNPYKSGEFALIQDFQSNEDQLILTGVAGDYVLGASPLNNISGKAIYLDANSNQNLDSDDEILAIVQGSDPGSLSNNSFKYV